MDPTFGQPGADASVWSKIASLISSVRMVVRRTCALMSYPFAPLLSPDCDRCAKSTMYDPELTVDHAPPTAPLIIVNTVIIVYELILG